MGSGGSYLNTSMPEKSLNVQDGTSLKNSVNPEVITDYGRR
jgi:hypothetical protein